MSMDWLFLKPMMFQKSFMYVKSFILFSRAVHMHHLDNPSYASDISCLPSFYYQIQFKNTKVNACVYFLFMSIFLVGHPSLHAIFSTHSSIMHHISGTVHHVVIIFGTHVQNDDISRRFFHFLLNFVFLDNWGVKGQKKVQNEN